MARTITQLRTRIAALQAERDQIAKQPLSREAVRAHVVEYAERMEAEFASRAGVALRRIAAGGHLVGAFTAHAGREGSVDIGPALVGAFGAATFAAALLSHLDSVPGGVDAEARAARLAEIAAELDRLEIEEEALIEASEAAGKPIERRPDCRPEIVLRATAP